MIRRSLFVLALGVAAPLVGLTGIPLASAQDASKSPAKDEIAAAAGSMKKLEQRLADKTDWSTSKEARSSAETWIRSAEGAIGRVKKADPKWDVSTWDKMLAEAKARQTKAETLMQKRQDDETKWKSAYSDYYNVVNKLESTLKLMAKVQDTPGEVEVDSEQSYRNTAENMAAVEAIDKACKARGFGALPVHPDYKSLVIPADIGCRVAANWKQIGKKYVELQCKGGAKTEAERLARAIDALKRGESITAQNHGNLLDPKGYINALKPVYEEPAKAFDVKVDGAWFSAVTDVAAKYPPALAEAAKTNRWDKEFKISDVAAMAFFSAVHGKGGDMPEGKVVKVAAFSDWSVEKDVFNVPVSRERNVQVLVKVKGESYCRRYGTTMKSSYKQGAWSKPSSMAGGANIQISSCQ